MVQWMLRRNLSTSGVSFLKEFIGIKCEQNDDGTIVLDMTRYNEELVKRHGFAQAHRASAPGKPGKILSEVDCACPDDENPPDATAYRSKVGGCLWLCRVALPIIAYQVCALARFNHAPGKVHWDAVNDLMRYLSTSADPRIVYKRTGKPPTTTWTAIFCRTTAQEWITGGRLQATARFWQGHV